MHPALKMMAALYEQAGNWLDHACETIDRTMTMWAGATVIVAVPYFLFHIVRAYGVSQGWWLP